MSRRLDTVSHRADRFPVWGAGLALLAVVWAGAGLARGDERITAPFVDHSHAERAYGTINRWLDSGQVPEQADSSTPVTGLIGVRVTLRSSGLTLGAGEAFRSDINDVVGRHGPAVDLMPLVHAAAQEAFEEARATLGRMHVNVPDGPEFDRQTILARQAPLIQLDLQLGHGLTGVQVSADADNSAVFATFASGYHGLRIPTPTGGRQSVHWPATVLAANLTPRSQLTHLLQGADLQAQQLPLVARPGGFPLQRFQVIHLVRPHRDLPIMHLTRGNVLLPTRPISDRTVGDIGTRLGEHLSRRFTSRDEVRGTYLPTSDRYDPELASDEEAALAGYALMRHASLRLTREGENDQSARMLEQARRTAETLARKHTRDDDAAHPAVVALTLLTLVEMPGTGVDIQLRDELLERLLQFRVTDGGFRPSLAQDEDRQVNQATDALIVAALSSLYERTREPVLGRAVSAELSRLWAASQRDLNVAALPWFMLAHDRSASLLADDELALRRLQTRRQGLGELVDLLIEQQVTASPQLGPDDVIGGFDLTPGPAGSPPTPDWRTAQLLVFQALTLRDERIAQDRDAIGWLLSAGLASRFLGQLVMDEPSAYYVRSRADALGGVRLALWDNRLAVAPLAMTLLAVTELQETTEGFTPDF